MDNYIKNFNRIKYGKKNSSRTTPTHKVIGTVIDHNTGEVVKQVEYSVKQKQAKKGWCKMYPKDFATAMLKIVNKPLATKIVYYFMSYGYFKKDGTIKYFKQKDLCDVFNATESGISKALKTLKDNEIIYKIEGQWRYNPFLFGISGQSDAELYDAQKYWDYHMGAYITDKYGNTNTKYKE